MTFPSVPADTDRDVRRRQIERWRAMPAHERAAVADQLSIDVAELAMAGIRFDHPEASSDEVRNELARRRFGRDLDDGMIPSRRQQ